MDECGLHSFEDFLGDLKGARRGMIRSERKAVCGNRLTFERVEGSLITPAFIDDFMPLYLSTYAKYGSPALISSMGFHLLRENMAEQMVFHVALLDDDLVAATMFMYGGDTLYALHWGTRIDVPFLHFELTYYQGVELAIERNFKHFDAGPVGKHKPPRGLAAMPSFHSHWFADAEFAQMVAPGMARRMQTVLAQKAELDLISAYRPALGREAWPEFADAAK